MWKQVMMGSAIVFGGTLVSRFFTFIYSAILIRELSVTDYAIFSLLMSILSWVLVFSHFDLYAAVSKFVSENVAASFTREAWNYYYNAVTLSFLLSLTGVIVTLGFSLNTATSKLYTLLFFLSLIPMALVTVNDGLIKGYQKFWLSALVDITGGISKFLSVEGFILIYGCLHINDALLLLPLASVVPLIASFVAVNRLLPSGITMGGYFEKKKCKRLLKYSKWVCMTDLANTGCILALNFMLSFYSYENLARFAVVILLYSVFQLSYGAITTVIIPKVATASVNGVKIKSLGKKELFCLFGATFVISAVLYKFPYQEQVLRHIFNKTDYADSFRLASIILLALPLRIVTMTNKGILQGLGYPEDTAKASSIALFFLIIVMVPLYKVLQLEGIILTLLVTYGLEYYLYSRAAKRRLAYSMLR